MPSVVSRQFAQQPAIGFGPNRRDQSLNPRIVRKFGRKAELVRLVANTQELEPGIFADEPHAHPDIGPAATNCFGDSAMVARFAARLFTALEQIVKTRSGA